MPRICHIDIVDYITIIIAIIYIYRIYIYINIIQYIIRYIYITEQILARCQESEDFPGDRQGSLGGAQLQRV